MSSPMRRAAAFRSPSRISSIAPSAAAHATGLPPYVPPRPPTCTASMISARPVTAASGSPPAMPLAVVIRSGTTASWSQANQSPVRQKPVWISSATKTIPLARANSTSSGRNPSAGTMKPPSPAIGSMMIAATLSAPISLSIRLIACARGLGAGQPVAEGVAQRHAVDLGGERAERVLVRHVLGGQAHRQVGAAVVAVLEHDDRLALGVGAGDLDRVLHGLGAGVEQRRALHVVTGGQLVEGLADRDVGLVRGDHEAGVGELGDLALHVLHDLRGRVAHGRHGDAGAHVDQGVAVHVHQHAAARGDDERRERSADAGGDGPGAALPAARGCAVRGSR